MMDAARLPEDYLYYLREIRNLTPATVESYTKDLMRYRRFLESRSINVISADRKTARGFLASLTRDGLSAKTVNRILSCLRGFYQYLLKREMIGVNPFVGIHGLKGPHHLPVFMFEDEVRRLVEIQGDSFLKARDRMIMELLYSTGCRVSELVGIDLKHIDRQRGTILIHGKGRKTRLVFLGESAEKALEHYLLRRKMRLETAGRDDQPALVLNYRNDRITQRGVAFLVRKYVGQTSLAKSVSPHTFRHSFATHILDRGADIRVVQELLGHSSLSSTQIYTHVGLDRLRKVYSGAHPHAEKQNGEK